MPGHRASRPSPHGLWAALLATLVTVVAIVGCVLIPQDAAPADADVLTAAPPSPAAEIPRLEPTTGRELPDASGHGRRIVFAVSRQRVWLVDARERVVSTYLASGSRGANLRPGSYRVYSRQRHATGIDDSGEMEFFVVFTHGRNAAIGFHSIPTKRGRLLQRRAELGAPRSHGCVRQRRPDAVRLWRFAPLGTRVVVTA